MSFPVLVRKTVVIMEEAKAETLEVKDTFVVEFEARCCERLVIMTCSHDWATFSWPLELVVIVAGVVCRCLGSPKVKANVVIL